MSDHVKLVDIKAFFKGFDYPKTPVKIKPHYSLAHPEMATVALITLLENNPGKKALLPYYETLLEIYNYFKNVQK